MITIINNLMEVERGDQFFKDETGEIKITCKIGYRCEYIQVLNLKDNMRYTKRISEEIPSFYELRSYIKYNNIKTVADLIKFMIDSEFEIVDMKSIKEFNPFVKIIKGQMKIKAKDGYFNKAQVKKILCHEDTEVYIKEHLTDDYLLDASLNFSKGVKVKNIDALEDVTNSFKSCCKEYNGKEFEIFVAGYSTTYVIKNNHITLI